MPLVRTVGSCWSGAFIVRKQRLDECVSADTTQKVCCCDRTVFSQTTDRFSFLLSGANGALNAQTPRLQPFWLDRCYDAV